MPWYVAKSQKCPTSKPYAVIKKSDGTVVPGGCHTDKTGARQHAKALYANVNEKKMGEFRDSDPR
jgi:hypothetical protein